MKITKDTLKITRTVQDSFNPYSGGGGGMMGHVIQNLVKSAYGRKTLHYCFNKTKIPVWYSLIKKKKKQYCSKH